VSRLPTLQCADRSGFLFAHACDRLATGQCVTCGKPICVEHTRLTSQGPRCITCLRQEETRDEPEGDDVSVERERHDQPAAETPPAHEGAFGGAGASREWSPEQAAASGTDPYFYGAAEDRRSQYDADDYAAFEPAAAPDDVESGPIESDVGAS
jgi:hypothetical protein